MRNIIAIVFFITSMCLPLYINAKDTGSVDGASVKQEPKSGDNTICNTLDSDLHGSTSQQGHSSTIPKTGDEKTVSPPTIQLLKCTEERECKAACGRRATASKCVMDQGICTCSNPIGPTRRCENPRHEHEECTERCGKNISQICKTDFGPPICTCFERNWRMPKV